MTIPAKAIFEDLCRTFRRVINPESMNTSEENDNNESPEEEGPWEGKNFGIEIDPLPITKF
jgi:hypothetical protein